MHNIKLNNSLAYLLIFTIIASVVAYTLIIKGYDTAFDAGYYSGFDE